jgi:nucleotide-binding universal stress UspA family protein
MIRTVAAGVGGADGWQALAWAAEEADRAGARLVIVHACRPGSPLDRLAGEPTSALVELCDPPLARAAGAVRTRLGGQRVALTIRTGDAATALIDASAGVEVLVIGAGTSGRTTRRVLRHAHCPVVVVHPVSQGRDATFAGHVVVGVDGSAAGRAALEFAFAYANEHRLPVAAAHVSAHGDDDYFYDDTTMSMHFAVEPAALELLAAEVEPWSLKYPHVSIRRAVLCGAVIDGLVRAGAGAHLLVVGDKRRGMVSRARTGDVPLAVAQRAACPTAIVPLDRLEGEPL